MIVYVIGYNPALTYFQNLPARLEIDDKQVLLMPLSAPDILLGMYHSSYTFRDKAHDIVIHAGDISLPISSTNNHYDAQVKTELEQLVFLHNYKLSEPDSPLVTLKYVCPVAHSDPSITMSNRRALSKLNKETSGFEWVFQTYRGKTHKYSSNLLPNIFDYFDKSEPGMVFSEFRDDVCEDMIEDTPAEEVVISHAVEILSGGIFGSGNSGVLKIIDNLPWYYKMSLHDVLPDLDARSRTEIEHCLNNLFGKSAIRVLDLVVFRNGRFVIKNFSTADTKACDNDRLDVAVKAQIKMYLEHYLA